METKVVTTSELLKKIRVLKFDTAAAARVEAEASRGPVTCKKGCSECCKQKVILAEGEAIPIFLYLRDEARWTPKEEARLAAAETEARLTSHPDWFAERKPCPFLKDDECSIHPVRPIACLGTFSSAGDPKLCAEPDPEKHGTYLVVGEGETAEELIHELGGLPNTGFYTIAGAVLTAAAIIQGKEKPDVAFLPLTTESGEDRTVEDTITQFDALGNRIILI